MRLKSSLLYKFSCAQCASEYVGMTARTLGTRVDEQVGAVTEQEPASLSSFIRQYVIIDIELSITGVHLTPVILKY